MLTVAPVLSFLDDERAVLIRGYHDAFFAMIDRVASDGDAEGSAYMEIVSYRVPR